MTKTSVNRISITDRAKMPANRRNDGCIARVVRSASVSAGNVASWRQRLGGSVCQTARTGPSGKRSASASRASASVVAARSRYIPAEIAHVVWRTRPGRVQTGQGGQRPREVPQRREQKSRAAPCPHPASSSPGVTGLTLRSRLALGVSARASLFAIRCACRRVCRSCLGTSVASLCSVTPGGTAGATRAPSRPHAARRRRS